MYTTQHQCMQFKFDVSGMQLIYVIFQYILLRITVINLTKHRCIHVRNFVHKKAPEIAANAVEIFLLQELEEMRSDADSSSYPEMAPNHKVTTTFYGYLMP